MGRSPESIASAVETFIRGEFRVQASDRSFHRDVPLYDSGFVDSAGVVELIAFLESTFDVELTEEDIFSEHFTTINGISSLIHLRLSGNPPGGDESCPAGESDGLAAAEPGRRA